MRVARQYWMPAHARAANRTAKRTFDHVAESANCMYFVMFGALQQVLKWCEEAGARPIHAHAERADRFGNRCGEHWNITVDTPHNMDPLTMLARLRRVSGQMNIHVQRLYDKTLKNLRHLHNYIYKQITYRKFMHRYERATWSCNPDTFEPYPPAPPPQNTKPKPRYKPPEEARRILENAKFAEQEARWRAQEAREARTPTVNRVNRRKSVGEKGTQTRLPLEE